MTNGASRVARLSTAALLAALPLYTTPTAAAVTPPPVDDSQLPKPASPSPPRPTEQQHQCVISNGRSDEIAIPDS